MPERLSEWAHRKGVHHKTAYKWFVEGKMPVPSEKISDRLIMVYDPELEKAKKKYYIYARVSSHDQKNDLEGQVARILNWATSNGYGISGVVQEVASGMNERRKKLQGLLIDPQANIIVEHRDRFSRFGFDLIQKTLSSQGRTILVMDDAEIEDDIVRDATEILTSLCARIYGKRSAKNKLEKAVKELEKDEQSVSIVSDSS